MCNSVYPITVRKTAGIGHCVLRALPGPHHSAYGCSVVHVLSETDVATCIKIETLLSPQATVLRDFKCKQYKTPWGEVTRDFREAGNMALELNFCFGSESNVQMQKNAVNLLQNR